MLQLLEVFQMLKILKILNIFCGQNRPKEREEDYFYPLGAECTMDRQFSKDPSGSLQGFFSRTSMKVHIA